MSVGHAPEPVASDPPVEESAEGGLAAAKAKLVAAVAAPTVWGRIAAVAIALVLALPVFLASGADPGEAYGALLNGSFGSLRALGDVLNRVDTFLLLGLGIAVCIRAGFFNVGAEGQLWLGALGATIVGVYWDGPATLVVITSLLAGFVFGALWSGLVALLKIVAKVDELIGSLMLNYVAVLLIGYLTFGPIAAYRAGQSKRLPDEHWLPTIIPGTRLHAGILIGLLAVALIWLLLHKTTFGYEIRTVGSNPQAARFAGINANRVIARVSLLGGGLCGLAGANAVLGVQHVLLDNFSTGIGYTAIAVALLGSLSPLGILLASVLFGALEIGASNMQYVAKVPAALGGLIEGLILVLFLIGVTFTLRRRRRAKEAI